MNRSFQNARILFFAILLACTSWLLGCGPGEPPSGSVAGKVTYNGKPLTSGVVTLVNDEAGIGASGELDVSGRYRIDSIRTGQYKVAIHREPPPLGARPDVIRTWKLNIPEQYQDFQSSGLTATVNEGDNTVDFGL